MATTEPTGNRKSPFSLPKRSGLSEETLDRIRVRSIRQRMQSVMKYARPLKFLAFILVMAVLAYLAIIQLKYLFFSTSYFELKKVEVSGREHPQGRRHPSPGQHCSRS